MKITCKQPHGTGCGRLGGLVSASSSPLRVLLLFLAALPLQAAAELTLVHRGQAAATVVVAADAPQQVSAAADLLVELVRQATGTTLPRATEPRPGSISVFIGSSPGTAAFVLDQSGLSADGFDITFPAGESVLILGPTPWGTEFGVYDFLERYVGVRWLVPGPYGTDVPSRDSLVVPTTPVRQDPAFFSRQMSGFRGAAQSEWARRNRMHGQVSFHHNLRNLFAWETYVESNPEFYPLVDGKRYLPTREEGWQPCFTAPGSVEEAIRVIGAYFDANPNATSYSLGINDNRNYCQCPSCKAKHSGQMNFLGIADYSDLYYEWCNRVVEGVLAKHPDAYFGLLAYSNVAAPPERVRVHPRIIPFMTYDRMKWIHPDLRTEGEEMTRLWHQRSPTLGWYDYIYGRPYMLPRVWFHHMADYYRFGLANGVRAQYAEAYPNWGEGPKLYLALKLQWDPQQDVDALLDDWCMRMGGSAAGPYIRQYYAFWEDFWTRRILDSSWFRLEGQYLPHRRDPTYLRDITEAELAQCRQWLEAARAATQTRAQGERVQLLLDAFSFSEASALVYQVGDAPAPTTQRQAHDLLERTARAFAMGEFRRRFVAEVLPEHPVLGNIGDVLLFEHDRGLVQALWEVYAWVAEHEAEGGTVMERFRGLLADHRDDALGEILAMAVSIHEHPERLRDRVRNGSFEETMAGAPVPAQEGPDWDASGVPPHWRRWIRPGTSGEVLWVAGDAHAGNRSVRITGATAASVLQSVTVTPGDMFRLSAWIKARVNPRGYTRVSVQWQDEKGAWLKQPAVQAPVPSGETAGWVMRTCFFRVPEGAGRAVVGLSVGGQGDGDYACFDSIVLQQVILDP